MFKLKEKTRQLCLRSFPVAFAPRPGPAAGLFLPLLPFPLPVLHHVGPLPLPHLLQVPPSVVCLVFRLSFPIARRFRWLLPLPLLLPLLCQNLHLIRLLRLLLLLLCLLLLLMLYFHLDLPLFLIEFLLTLLFLSELLHFVDLLLADHVPVVVETVVGSLVSIPEWFLHFKILIIRVSMTTLKA